MSRHLRNTQHIAGSVLSVSHQTRMTKSTPLCHALAVGKNLKLILAKIVIALGFNRWLA